MKIIIFIVLFIETLRIGETQNKKTRMMGGDIVKPGQFPFVVALLNKKLTAVCTGSLITYEKILTAAHCVHNSKIKKCLAGEVNGNVLRDNNGTMLSGQAREVKTFVMHPEAKWSYIHKRQTSPTNDLAFITVLEKFQQSELVSLINLGTAALKQNDPCIAIGYGTHKKEGDSGGPLINSDVNVLLGVAYGRAPDFAFALYVSVVEHRNWIMQQIQEKAQENSRRAKSIGTRCEISRASISTLLWLLSLWFSNYSR